MALTLLIATVFIIIICYYVVPSWNKYRNLRKEYKNIFSLPVSPIPFVGNLHQFDKKQHVFSDLLLKMSSNCQKQGQSLFCLWFSLWPMVFACRARALATFINHNKQLVKSYDYTFLEPWLKTGLLTSNNAKWRTRRRLITPSFHDNQLLMNFISIFNEQAMILGKRIDNFLQKQKTQETIDLYPYISTCTLDIISETAMGENVGAQASDGECEFVLATIRIAQIINERIRSPWLWPRFIFDRSPLGQEQVKVLEVLHSFSRNIIQRHIEVVNSSSANLDNHKPHARRQVFLDSLISQMQSEQLTLDDVQEEVDTFMFEGHDTTAAAINFTCYLLGRHPDIQKKVQDELDSIFGDDRDRSCTMEDLQEMNYLDIVIKESMRVLPPVPAVIREAQEDFDCDGQLIRKGTTVYIFIMGVNYDAEVFPEPEKFDPERFSKGALFNEERSPYAFIPFSAGSRNCIGQRFALLEEKVILSTIFRRYSIRTTQTIEELQLSFESIMRPTVPIEMNITQRS